MKKALQELREDKKQLQQQLDFCYKELGQLRRYIVLTRMLRRAEDDLTTTGYNLTKVTRLRALRDSLIEEMCYEDQINEVLDDIEGKVEKSLDWKQR